MSFRRRTGGPVPCGEEQRLRVRGEAFQERRGNELISSIQPCVLDDDDPDIRVALHCTDEVPLNRPVGPW